jgi:hypothetical protein
MEQRLRLVQGNHGRADKRSSDRRRLAVPGQIVWKDDRGTTRIAAVRTRDVSEYGVSVECLGGIPIPRFRLVYFQIDRDARGMQDLPAALRKASVLSAVFRVGDCQQSTGAPSDYALRLLVEPRRSHDALTSDADVEALCAAR